MHGIPTKEMTLLLMHMKITWPSPRTHRPVWTEPFAFSTSPNGAHTKAFLPRLVTPRLIPDAHTAAAPSLLLLQSIHIQQVPSRS